MLLAFAEELGLLSTLLAADATRFEVTSPPLDFAITFSPPPMDCGHFTEIPLESQLYVVGPSVMTAIYRTSSIDGLRQARSELHANRSILR
jgi:hypothetical protein